jgi:tRNA(fMet)-specific endonuclease VapC
MNYLLDSNTCIRYLNGRSLSIVRKVKATPAQQIIMCSVVKAEMWFGARRSQQPEETRAKQDEFFALFESVDFDDAAADHYSRIRADLATLGTPIGPNDVMIAAIALARNLILVTHNTNEFSRVRGLVLEDWEIVDG